MFYSGNDNYMQDLYFYNQTPNNTYNPYMNMPNNFMQNPSMLNNMNGMCMGSNNNMGMNNMRNMNNSNMAMNPNSTNLTSLYPSIYRILNPVVSRVVQNSNYQFLNEDTLNNMVETVYSIVDGQIDYNDTVVTTRESQAEINSNSNTSSNNVASNTTRNTDIRQTNTTSNSNSNMNTNTSLRDSRNDSLLKDLIKILIIKELIARRNFSNGPFNPNQYYTGIPQANMNF